MHVSIGDRLFVAITKRLGVSRHRLQRLRRRQTRWKHRGQALNMFSVARHSGWLGPHDVEVLVQCARLVVAQRPEFACELFEKAAAPAASTWEPALEVEGADPFGEALPPSTAQLTQADRRRARRRAKRSRFSSDDLLPTVDGVGEAFAQHLESQVDAFTSSTHMGDCLPAGRRIGDESIEIDDLLDLLQPVSTGGSVPVTPSSWELPQLPETATPGVDVPTVVWSPSPAEPPHLPPWEETLAPSWRETPVDVAPAGLEDSVSGASWGAQDSALFNVDWEHEPREFGAESGEFDPFGPPMGSKDVFGRRAG